MNKVICFLLAISLVVASSCSDFLEKLPDQRTVLNSPQKVAQLLTSAYPQANYIPFLEAMSDNANDKGLEGTDLMNSEFWHYNDVPSFSQDTPNFYWQAAYAAIASANIALEAIENASNVEPYLPCKGEALVARAYSHFMLVTFFSKVYNPLTASLDPGIPYVLKPEKVISKRYERKTVAYVYEQIEKDLMEGIPLLDDSKFQSNSIKFHFTTSAAHAFAARFFLFKREYAKSVEHSNLVFDGADVLSYLRPINSVEYRSMEPLVKLAAYTKSTEPANILLVEAPSIWARSLRSYRYGFDFKLFSTLIFGANPTTGNWSYSFYGTDESLFTPKFREHFVKSDPNANYGTPVNIIPLLTAEEVLFNRAEANIMLGNYDDAVQDLNYFASQRVIVNETDKPYYDPEIHTLTQKKLRDFYTTTDTRRALLNTVLDFKRIEFVYEGLRWFDILRHNIPVTHASFNGLSRIELGAGDLRRVIQIPKDAEMSGIELNPR